MKTKLSIFAFLLFCCSMLSGQGTLPPWLIEWAPGPGYVLYSGPGGAYNHALLSTLVGTGSDPDSNLYSVDGSILDPIRTVNLSGSRLIFSDIGSGYVSINSGREIGLFSIKRNGALDSLVFRFDYGLGTDYGLMLDGPGGQREIFTTSSTILAMGGGYNSFVLQATIPTDNTLTTVLAKDPTTDQIKEIDLSTLSGGRASACQDTIIQAAHGFSLGDLLGQTLGGYFLAHTNAPDSLPVSFVCNVIDANTFTIGTEGWINWNHGLLPDTDYFLQDDGSVATTADTDYTVFAFRTFGGDKVAFDISELIVDGSTSDSGSSIIASNGLNDFDPGPGIDIELGGDMERNTLINGQRLDILWDSFLNFYIQNIQGEVLIETDTLGDRQAYLIVDVANSDLVNINYATNTKARLTVNQNGAVTLVSSDVDGANPRSFTVTKNHISANGIPQYASDAAADADLSFPTGGFYTVTGDRSIRIKP